ncbi:hypothetical protein GCM10010937_08060 [Gluconobacter japonicus]|uniref:Uncharacterized protein n=1 Tax=Gluconobacter japonicus TaxID=376620 RepID=A0ABQ5WH27_GLUJA|nr:hypothetical protein AA3271_1696 [Gluconobacter japonicus NBRC 3271]GLQ59003.1 hypothetical protein GCM10010937_08060 [Gluconobacter japonicus]
MGFVGGTQWYHKGILPVDDGRYGCSRALRSQDDDRRDLSEGASYGFQSAGKKDTGRLIGPKGGMNTKFNSISPLTVRTITL